MSCLEIEIPYSPRYPELHEAMQSTRFVVLVAHRRFGKTVLAVNHLLLMALECEKERGMFAYVAPFRNQAKQIAWGYLKHYANPVPGRDFNESDLAVSLPNGSQIRIFGADNPDSLRGLYFDGVVMDEVAQMKPDVWEEIIRPALSDRMGWSVFIGTPKGVNLFYKLYQDAGEFRDKGNKDWNRFVYRVDETNAIPEKEYNDLKAELSEQAWRQEMLCDFTAASDDILITPAMVAEAQAKVMPPRTVHGQPIVIGVDVARHGSDSTVFAKRQGLVCFQPIVYRNLDNMEVADRLMNYIRQEAPDAVFVDSGGGAGVIDRCKQLGVKVTEAPFGARAIHDDRFINRRVEMWVAMRDWLASGGALPDDNGLGLDLQTPKYGFDNAGRLKLESKEDIKKRLGRSPDKADALALTFYAPVSCLGVHQKGVISSRPKYQTWG